MSRMLSLFASGYAAATDLATSGRRAEARKAYDALLRQTITPEERVQTLMAAGKLAYSAEQYRRARRHLLAAGRLAPGDATIQYELGCAFENDPYGCDRRATRRYRKACQLNAKEPIYRASLGRAMIRIRELTSGVNVLRRAAKEAPTDVAVLEVVADGLREAGRNDLAFNILSQARFLAPANGDITRLWSRAKYDLAAEQQRITLRSQQRALPEGHPVALKLRFAAHPQGQVRRDNGCRPASHLGRLKAYNSDLG